MPMNTINFDHLHLSPSDRLLDLGCGEGRHALTACMLEQVNAVGVDLNIKDLQTTQQRFHELNLKEPGEQQDCGNLSLSVANGLKLPFANAYFDKVICAEVLEHIPDYRGVINEISRVLKPGGIMAISVPRYLPEKICWLLSDEYHAQEGGHIRIFNARKLRHTIENCGLIHFRRHWAHALHVPYWWLKCLLWREAGEDAWIVRTYHRLLVWDLMKQPRTTRWLERMLDPIMGKSVVMYFVKGCQ